MSLGEMRRDLERELVLMKAATANFVRREPEIQKLEEIGERLLSSTIMDVEDFKAVARIVLESKRYNQELQDAILKVGALVKMMADVDNKTAQTKALEQIGKLTLELKLILSDYLTREQYDACFEQIKRRVIDPQKLGLELSRSLDE